MARALDVARYLIHLAVSEEEPDLLTHLRLQKLLYYVQGWSLAQRNKPMFPDRIEAWAHGPVVRNVYASFAGFRYGVIPGAQGGIPDAMTPGERTFTRSVWEAYKVFSATSLRSMTHRERPWLDARGALPAGARCEREITKAALREGLRREGMEQDVAYREHPYSRYVAERIREALAPLEARIADLEAQLAARQSPEN